VVAAAVKDKNNNQLLEKIYLKKCAWPVSSAKNYDQPVWSRCHLGATPVVRRKSNQPIRISFFKNSHCMATIPCIKTKTAINLCGVAALPAGWKKP